jgi:tRNA A37 N6-isopentenylltransferase MiaA
MDVLRLRAFLDGLESFPAFNPDAEGGPKAAERLTQELADEFARLRRTSLEEIDRIQPEDWNRTSRHSELGMVTLSEMQNEWPAHDLNLTIQAERALMQPFIQSCGPWKVYFADHIIEKA